MDYWKWDEEISKFRGVLGSFVFGSRHISKENKRKPVPGSDWDIRVVLDEPTRWGEVIPQLIGCFRQNVMIADEAPMFVRLVLEEGLVVDLGGVLEGHSFNEESVFLADGPKPAHHEIARWVAEVLTEMLAYPAIVARSERGAARLYCSLYRVDLAKLIYRYEGRKWAKGFKHMATWTPLARLLDVADSDIWDAMLQVLRLMADEVYYKFPERFVESCRMRYRDDLDKAEML